MSRDLVVFKVGDTLAAVAAQAGDFENWIARGVAQAGVQVRIVDARTEALPAAGEVAGAVVTGSHAMVTDRPDWSEKLAAWLRDAVDAQAPVLGICYGHQLLAHALGGSVGYHPQGIEIGTVPVDLAPEAAGDPLLAGLPSRFQAHVIHSQTVTALPKGAVRLASNAHEATQAFRFGAQAWGVQFHPEFDASVMKAYVRARQERGDLGKADAAITVADAPAPARILRNFGACVAGRRER